MKALRLRRRFSLHIFVCTSMLTAMACATPVWGQEPSSLWNAVAQPQFDATKTATVSNVTIKRDRLQIVLSDGVIQFAKPVNGIVFAAVFQGHGHLTMTPPNAIEAQQLRLFTKQDVLSLDFTQGVFSFTDGTYEEIGGKLQENGAAAAPIGNIYEQRQHQREDDGEPLTARLFEGSLSADHKQMPFFNADLKTNMDWIQASFDAQDPEEVMVGRWTESQYRKGFDTWMHFPAGDRTSSEAFRDPMAKEPFEIEGYQIDATVTSGADLGATTRLALNHRVAGKRVLVFDLNGNLRVDSVKNAQGASLPFFQVRESKDRDISYGDYVAVLLLAPTEAGQKETLEFHYAGKRVVRQEGVGNYFCPSYGWSQRGQTPLRDGRTLP